MAKSRIVRSATGIAVGMAAALLSSAALVAGAAAPAFAQTYDASADFSTTINPNGVWSYGTESLGSLGLGFTLLSLPSDSSTSVVAGSPIKGWASSSADGLPFVVINTSATSQTIPTTAIVLAPGQIEMHPGADGAYSIIRFIAPTSQAYSVNSLFTGIDNGAGTTTDVHVLQNGTSLFSGEVTGDGATQSYTASSLTLAAGDTLDFVVGYGTDGNDAADSTSPTITIMALPPTAAPEPGSLALLGAALLPLATGVALRSRRREPAGQTCA